MNGIEHEYRTTNQGTLWKCILSIPALDVTCTSTKGIMLLTSLEHPFAAIGSKRKCSNEVNNMIYFQLSLRNSWKQRSLLQCKHASNLIDKES